MRNLELFNTILFIVVYVSVPIFGYRMLRVAGIEIMRVSIPSIFFMYYLLLAFLGMLPLYFGLFDYRVQIGVTNANNVFQMLMYSATSLMLILGGFLLTSWVIGKKNIYLPPVKPLRRFTIGIIIVLVVISLLVTYEYLKHVPGIALVTSFSDPVYAKFLRSQMTNDFNGPLPYHYYNLFFAALLPFFVLILCSNAIKKGAISSWVLFGVVFFVTALILVLDTQKAPVIWLLMSCFLVFYHVTAQRIKFNKIVLLGVSISVLFALMYSTFMGMGGRSFFDLVFAAVDRVTAGGLVPAYFYLEIFPDQVGYLMGRSFPNPRDMFPWEHYRITVEVMNYIFPDMEKRGIVGTAPTVYWAELYANFGPFATLFFSPLVGVALYLAHYYLERLQDSPVKSAIIVWCSMHFMKLAETSLSSYLLDIKLLTVILVGLIILLVENSGKIRMYKRITISRSEL